MVDRAGFKYPIYYIEWEDASTSDGWEGVEDLGSPTFAHTVGFLVKEDPQRIVIAMSYAGDMCNGTIVIPAAMIKTKKVIKK